MTFSQERFDDLIKILETPRKSRSLGENQIIDRYIKPLGTKVDGKGNHIIRIGTNPILWSSHTDTVHATDKNYKLYQEDTKEGSLIHTNKKSILGADDGAGIWIMRNMIMNQIEGLYIFHRDEEIGGLGSSHIKWETPELLNGIKHAVAFDRKGTQDIITHQMRGKCCSNEFAEDFAKRIRLDYRPSVKGSFTDTANYAEIIPECTNISVGYYYQHSQMEYLNYTHLEKLLEHILVADFNNLICERDVKDNSSIEYINHTYTSQSIKYNNHEFYNSYPEKFYNSYPEKIRTKVRQPQLSFFTNTSNSHYDSLLKLIKEDPELIADYLEEIGIDTYEIMEWAGGDKDLLL
jgi:hypothetical protein